MTTTVIDTEAGSVTLPAWAVESLRARITRCLDETATDQERRDERFRLVGALEFHLLLAGQQGR